MSYDTTEFIEAVQDLETKKKIIDCACEWMKSVYDDGFDDAESEYNLANRSPDLTEELGWLRTRIMRGEVDDALKLVDDVEHELSPTGTNRW